MLLSDMVLLKDLGSQLRKDKSGYQRTGLFKCVSCPNTFEIPYSRLKLRKHNTCRSCTLALRSITHGESGTKNHMRWSLMKIRCLKNYDKGYKNYGGRGITIYPKWIESYEAYRDYILSLPNAMEDGLSVDRINNDGNYEPNNLRWATHVEQANNRRKRTEYPKRNSRGVFTKNGDVEEVSFTIEKA